MSIGINRDSNYEQAKMKQEAAQKAKENAERIKNEAENKVSSATIQSETNSREAENASVQAGIKANEVNVISEKLNSANLSVNSAQQAYNNVLSQLSQAQASGNNDNILSAQRAVSSAYNKLQEVMKNAAQLQQELNKVTKEAEDAAKKAEIKQKSADEALVSLNNANIELSQAEAKYNTAIAELEVANTTLQEAENAIKNEKTDSANNTSSIENSSHLSQVEIDELVENGATYITSKEDFLKIFQGGDFDPKGNYILGCDIDLNDINWKPVGNEKEPFSGVFNGNGYSIDNLTINTKDSNVENIGFFGITANAEIKNITFNNASVITPDDYVNGSSSVGIVVGKAMGTIFDNIDVSGEVSGYESIGGIAGTIEDCGSYRLADDSIIDISNSLISNVSTSVEASGKYYVGGLVGYVKDTSTAEGVARGDLKINNCSTSGNIDFEEESAGGLIGEAGKTVITINNSNSSVNISWNNIEDDSDVSFLMETGRVGGFIGCANGTYIAICGSEFNGKLNAEGDFKGKTYGWYMNDAHITTYDIPGGLPIDDILNINGIDGLTPITNSSGNAIYQVKVSTLTGLDKMVSMIQAQPELADLIIFEVNFDFESMDGMYDSSVYAQYGIVQEIYQDDDGKVHNDVYIDNEMDIETTIHENNIEYSKPVPPPEALNSTMVSGLYKNHNEEYVVITSDGTKTVNLTFNYDKQVTNITKRLDSDEVLFREYITTMVQYYQKKMMTALKALFDIKQEINSPIINKAEYKKLQKMKDAGIELTKEQKYAMAVYEVDSKVSDKVANVIHNKGCGMGGNASFLDESKAIQMYDEQGRPLFTTLSGAELRQRMNEDGSLATDENGNPVYEYYNGEDYMGFQDVFAQRGYPITDENGNLLYTDNNGDTITKSIDENGNEIFINQDGSIFEGEIDELKQQLEPYNLSEEFSNLEKDMQNMVNALESGKYPQEEISQDVTISQNIENIANSENKQNNENIEQKIKEIKQIEE